MIQAPSATSRSRRGSRRPRNRNFRQRVERVPRSFNPLPMTMDADLQMTYTGGIPIGAALTNIFSVNIAALFRPFATGVSYQITNTVTGPTPFSLTSTLGSSTSNSPLGYGFASSNYQNFKVLEADMSVTTYPQAAGDSCATFLFPSGAQETPISGSWTAYLAASQNGVKTGRAIYGANSKLNTVRIRTTPYFGLGFTRQQWLDQPPTAMNGTPAIPSYIIYGLGVMDGAANAGIIVVDVVLRLRVRLSDPQQLNS